MPRFVVLRHEYPPGHERKSHFDLMLERDGALLTWAIAALPRPGETLAAQRLADHRLAYLDYEGEISGGRGSVARVDRGELSALAVADDRVVADVVGARLKGRLTLVRASDAPAAWTASLE